MPCARRSVFARSTVCTDSVWRWPSRSISSLTSRSALARAASAVEVQLPDGSQVHFEYDGQHRVTGICDAEGGIWKRDYDAQGRMVENTGANAAVHQQNQGQQVMGKPNQPSQGPPSNTQYYQPQAQSSPMGVPQNNSAYPPANNNGGYPQNNRA